MKLMASGRDLLRRKNEVSLVLPILVVHDDHEAAGLQRFDGGLDRGKGGLFVAHPDDFLTGSEDAGSS